MEETTKEKLFVNTNGQLTYYFDAQDDSIKGLYYVIGFADDEGKEDACLMLIR